MYVFNDCFFYLQFYHSILTLIKILYSNYVYTAILHPILTVFHVKSSPKYVKQNLSCSETYFCLKTFRLFKMSKTNLVRQLFANISTQPEISQACYKLWVLPACYKLLISCNKPVDFDKL